MLSDGVHQARNWQRRLGGSACNRTSLARRARAGSLGEEFYAPRIPAASGRCWSRLLILPDAASPNSKWLRVKLAASGVPGLAADDVFYVGYAKGEAGSVGGGFALVNSTDVNAIKLNPHTSTNPTVITDPTDNTKDSLVNTTDANNALLNLTTSSNGVLNFASRAVSGSPLWNFWPGRIWKVQVRPSSDSSHFSATPGPTSSRMRS